MRAIVTDRVAWPVGLSVTLVSLAKTAEQIEMPFGLRARMGPTLYSRMDAEHMKCNRLRTLIE